MTYMEATKHIPVLLDESREWLFLANGKAVVDATLGGGGHTLAFLERVLPEGRVIAFDTDAEAIERFLDRIENDERANRAYREGKLAVVHRSFSELESELDRLGVEKADAIFADLGFSSDQIEDPNRGFSFLSDGPLDMRLDRMSEMTAADIVNRYSEERLADLFFQYGDESKSRRIAKRIVAEREVKPFRTTLELARTIESVFLGAERRALGMHPATKSFQALRIEVNCEQKRLETFLLTAVGRLKTGGRIGIISFHSGEDRVVKEFFRKEAKGCVCPPEFPECRCGKKSRLKILTGKPIVASEEEVKGNPRARSAKLRVAERIGE